jgi:hypothetical protein
VLSTSACVDVCATSALPHRDSSRSAHAASTVYSVQSLCHEGVVCMDCVSWFNHIMLTVWDVHKLLTFLVVLLAQDNRVFHHSGLWLMHVGCNTFSLNTVLNTVGDQFHVYSADTVTKPGRMLNHGCLSCIMFYSCCTLAWQRSNTGCTLMHERCNVMVTSTCAFGPDATSIWAHS